ncbi:hypothetical protein [Bacillus sp. FJAT-45037]|uniref:hypothetical protein n=1 Tax=Bacillus sp. FJAT-45037 TaxID=2011007 RepID=UPI0012FE3BA3|nr:hypothetical protein [Bacillus sp. FJAT-45037]
MKKSILITGISSLLLFSFSNTTWAETDTYYDPPKPNWEEIFENIESYPETGVS